MPDTLGERGSHVSDMSSATTSMGADKRVEIQIVAGGQRLDAIFEKVVEMVGAVKAQKHQCVGAKRRGQAAEAFSLLEGGVQCTSLRKRINQQQRRDGRKW